MRESLLRELRDKLETQHKVLQDSLGIDSSAGATVELDQTRQGRLSRMDAMQQQAMALAGQANVQRRIAQISAALKRIQDGSFGVCEACAEAISDARLQARPEARLCLNCKARNETSHRQ